MNEPENIEKKINHEMSATDVLPKEYRPPKMQLNITLKTLIYSILFGVVIGLLRTLFYGWTDGINIGLIAIIVAVIIFAFEPYYEWIDTSQPSYFIFSFIANIAIVFIIGFLMKVLL